MADNFNVKKFLAENKLGPYSRIKEGEAAYEYEKGKAAGEKEEKEKLAKEDYAGAEEEKMMDFLAEDVDPNLLAGIFGILLGGGPIIAALISDYKNAKTPEEKQQVLQRASSVISSKMGTNESKDDLKEYEVIYVERDGRCYRKDDEGNMDEVNMSYCRRFAEGKEEVDETKKPVEEALSSDAMERMDGLVPQTALKAVMSGTQAIVRDLKQEGFEDDEIFDFIMSKIKTLSESKKPTEEAIGGKNPEGDKLVLRFLQGVSKKFDYPVAKAAIFVKDTIKSLGY